MLLLQCKIILGETCACYIFKDAMKLASTIQGKSLPDNRETENRNTVNPDSTTLMVKIAKV